jgi:tetratricopeptide (TPR) repeat protein
MALCAKGQWCAQAGELTEARAACQEILDRLGTHPDVILEGMARIVLGMAEMAAGNLAEVDRQLLRAQEIEEWAHNREPCTNRFHGDHAEAVIGLGVRARTDVAARMTAQGTAAPLASVATRGSCAVPGAAQCRPGDLGQALADYQRALTAHESLDMPVELGRTLLALGRLHRRRNERQRAQDCLGRAAEVFDAAGAPRWPARSLAAPRAAGAAPTGSPPPSSRSPSWPWPGCGTPR